MIDIYLEFLMIVLFLGLSLVIFTLPAKKILQLLKLDPQSPVDSYTISTTLGFVIFTLLAYILVLVHLRPLIWGWVGYGLVSLVLFKPWQKGLKLHWSKKVAICLAVFGFGMLGQIFVNAPSGFHYLNGIDFWSSHGHDGIWHIALMEELKKGVVPFQNPEIAGFKLQNYHFFVDLLMSEISRLFRFSSLDVYFRLMTTFFSLLMGLSSFVLVRRWSGKFSAGVWAAIFMYFGGSFGFIKTLIDTHTIGGETMFWISQPQSTIGNPPHAAAFIILTVFLYGLYEFLHTSNKSWIWILIILGGASIEFKVYSGLLILGGLLVISLHEAIIFKKPRAVPLFLGTLIASLVLYLPNNANSQDFLIWQPWWYIRTMVVAPDRLNWLDMELRRQTYIAQHNWKRVVQLETEAFLIFLFGNLGMRFLGFFTIFKKLKNLYKSPFETFVISLTLASFLIPVFFLQKGVAWNSIQFTQYTLLLFGFWGALAADSLASRLTSRYIKGLIIAVIIFLAVPTQIGLLLQFYSNKPLSQISNEELAGLQFLKTSTPVNAVVLTPALDRYPSRHFNPPVPISTWYDTGYIPAFSQRRTFLSDEEQVNIMGYSFDHYKSVRQRVFTSESSKEVNNLLLANKIDYIYLVYGQKFRVPVEQLTLSKVYNTSEVQIFKVNKP